MKYKALKSAAALGTMITLSGCYFFPAEEELLQPPTVVVEDVAYSTYTAKTKTIEDKITASGYVASKTECEAAFPESGGTIKKIYVNAGQFVEEGELLAELDVGNLDYLYKQQQLIVKKAELVYNSTGSAEDALNLEMEKNTLTEYERVLSNSRLYAEMSGQVCFVEQLAPGSTVTAYKTIVKTVDPDNLVIRYGAAELKDFKLNDKITITVEGESYEGYVSKTPDESIEGLYDDYPAITYDTEHIYCEFKDDIPPLLSIGGLAEISLVKEVHENAVVISKNLVKTDGDRTYVTVLDENDNKMEADVTTGIETAVEVEILTGLKAGDKVVVR